ncbi:MAG: insulinase family protein [Acidobacteria bacterium]|nr:insulinase family protein [Acidobacteriota bacterium]
MKEDIKETRLDNALVVLTDRMPSVRSVTLTFLVRSGAKHEPDDLHGITHFIEHAVFKGTKKRSALDIAIEQDRLGGSLDAFTTHEETGFAIKVIDEQLSAAFDLVADMLSEPLFDEKELEAEQRVIIEEMKMVDDSPEDSLGDLFNEVFFPEHPLGRNIAGTPESVRTFDHEKTRAYHEHAFTSGNLVIAAAGNVEHDELLKLVSAVFQSPQAASADKATPLADAGAGAPASVRVPKMAAPLVIKNRADLEQAHLVIATPFVAAPDPRRYAADILANVIGGGMSSRLWQKIREERGLAYSVGASTTMYQDAGVFSIFAATSPEQVKEVVEVSVAELRSILMDGITQEELELSKQTSRASILLSLEDSASRSASLAQSEMVHGRQIALEETLAGVDAVTVDDCHKLAAEFFTTEKMSFVALGDLSGVTIEREHLVL